MKKLALIGLLIIGFIINGFSTELLVNKIKFASPEKANKLLTQEDNFTKNWSQFDIDSRMHKKNSTRENLFNFIAKQTREWTPKERSKIISIFKSIDNQIEKQGFKINFPNEIYFIKTTGAEEGDADGYTRANYVVLKDNILSKSVESLKETIIHELFHILTRNNPEFRKNMYSIIGFHLMNDVAYPESIKDYRITNPDAPQVDSYISIKVGRQTKNCMMILYSKQPYRGGDFFNYINVGFLSLTDDSVKKIEYVGKKPLIYSFNQISDFFNQVGRNTQYIIHPEEILADNFVLAILNISGLKSPQIVYEIQQKLKY